MAVITYETEIAKQLFNNAILGLEKPKIKYFKVSDANVDINTNWTDIPNAYLKKDIEDIVKIDQNSFAIMLKILANETNGRKVSIVGVYDNKDRLLYIVKIDPPAIIYDYLVLEVRVTTCDEVDKILDLKLVPWNEYEQTLSIIDILNHINEVEKDLTNHIIAIYEQVLPDSINKHNNDEFAHPHLLQLIEEIGGIDVNGKINYIGQSFETNVKFDSNVFEDAVVFKDSDGVYRLATSNTKQPVGIAKMSQNKVIYTGIVEVNNQEAVKQSLIGDRLYVSQTNAGKITLNETDLYFAVSLGNNRILLFNNIYSETKTLLIERPKILVPHNKQKDFYDEILSSEFKTSSIYVGKHKASEWIIAKDPAFTDVTEHKISDVYLTKYMQKNVEANTWYYVKVRYISEDNFLSDWSPVVSYKTPLSIIKTPHIYLDSDYNGTLYPKFSLSLFEVIGQDEWKQTEWEISLDKDFDLIILKKIVTDQDKYNVLEITDDILKPNTKYYIRARYVAKSGRSSKWATISYTTSVYLLEVHVPSQVNEASIIRIPLTHDGNRIFDINKYYAKTNVRLGKIISSSAETIIWQTPEIQQDQETTLTVQIFSKENNKPVSNSVTKNITVKNVKIIFDETISEASFTPYEYNNGWNI